MTSVRARLQAGDIRLEAAGKVTNSIVNGSYEFRVGNLETGEEIGYKGPYDLCCQFFNEAGKTCKWEGVYPNQTRTGGCPIPEGPFTASIRRPFWTNSLGAPLPDSPRLGRPARQG